MSRSNPLVLVHGVPDTPAIWEPLRTSLAPRQGLVISLALPGIAGALAEGTDITRNGLAAWVVAEVERLVADHGPVDIVGHDWGAILVTRAVCLRPELFSTWAVSGAVVAEDYPGHTVAKVWATPVLGELFMSISPRTLMKRILVSRGMPPSLADKEMETWSQMRRSSILSLYRSAAGLSRFEGWLDDLAKMPKQGMVIWGENDPYVPVRYAEGFATSQSVPIHVAEGAGHWVNAEKPEFFAEHLEALWKDRTPGD